MIMYVIKKSDEKEKFTYEKLSRSIQAANENTGEDIDIALLLAEFMNIVVDKSDVTTGQINVIVYGLLFSKGALKTLKNYAEYKV